MRVSFVSSWFPSEQNPNCTPFVPAFIKRFNEAGFDVDIITTNNGAKKFNINSKGTSKAIPIYRIDKYFPFFQLFKLIVKLRPDIIHVHAPNFFSSSAVAVGKILGIPVLATIHRVEAMPTKNPLVYLARMITLNLFDKVVAVSEAVKQLTENCGVHETKIRIIGNSADEDNFRPRLREKTRKLLSLPLEKKIVLFVGRLVTVKGANFLIQAMPLVLRKYETILVIVGEGSERGNLQHLAEVLNLNSYVLFPGQIPPEKLALYYNAADVFALPSLIEGHSVVLLEAMASGLPVVATNVGGNNEIIVDGLNGFLVDSMDHSSLAQSIIKIFNNKNLMRQFSKESLKLYLNSFSEKSQICKYFSEYNRLVDR